MRSICSAFKVVPPSPVVSLHGGHVSWRPSYSDRVPGDDAQEREMTPHHVTPLACSELHRRALSTSRTVEDHEVDVTLPRFTSRVRIPSPVTCTSTLSALQKHTSTVPRRRDGTRRRARGRVRCERPRAPHAVRLRDRGEPIVCSAREAFFQLAIAILVVTGER